MTETPPEGMSPLLWALINLVAKVGLDAAIGLLESKVATIDDALVALRRAKEKSLATYIDEDAARRMLVTPVPAAPPADQTQG